MTARVLRRSIHLWLGLFIAGLVLSGLTAFCLQIELTAAVRLALHLHLQHRAPALFGWLDRVAIALTATDAHFPFLAYGTDWLAFAHLVIAVAFVGPWRDPVRNQWVITFGIVACAAVLPLALIAGPIRGIPLFWRLIDGSFGVLGLLPLLMIRRRVQLLEALESQRWLPTTP